MIQNGGEGKEILHETAVKVIRNHIYTEVSPEKFLIYSFTHNTFAVIDLA
jgi:hypothetical protein